MAEPEAEAEIRAESEAEAEARPEAEAESEYTSSPESESETAETASENYNGPISSGILTFVYCLYIVLIIAGNTMVIVVMIKKRAVQQKVINMYIVSLAIADLLIGCLVVPSGLFDLYYTGGMAHLICRICHYFLHVARNSTIMGLTILTIDRFLRIMDKYQMTHRQAAIIIGIKWVCAALYAIRSPVFYDLVVKDVTGLDSALVCSIADEYAALNKYLVFFDTFLLFILPWSVLAVCYSLIIRKLMKEMKEKGEKDPDKIKTIKMLIIAVICCFIGLAPNHIFRFYVLYTKNWFAGSLQLVTAFQIIGFTNSWMRWILYCIFNIYVNTAVREMYAIITQKKLKPGMKMSHLSNRVIPLW